MKYISSNPGAINYRLAVMVILILLFIVVFFLKLDESQKEIERTSIIQTTKVITSSLAVVFATYAVKGQLKKLYLLAGGNPFVFLAEYQILPPSYKGVANSSELDHLDSGWFYLLDTGTIAYIPRYLEQISFFKIDLLFDDLNRSELFEPEEDVQRGLILRKL
ncbi:MAG: hypothetical protein ACI845_003495 [Gammaproteobacteria bacterium]